MSSLYARATPSQARILRAVEGAVKNATDAHPELQISPRHRRSIAKRAAGTLTAQWPAVLAAKPSENGPARTITVPPASSSKLSEAKGRGVSQHRRHSPMGRLHHWMRCEMWRLKAEPNPERKAALIDVFRKIAEVGE